ncbi:hypothetical protein HY492_00650 [Candidatus Woesearchaeota archaeon]|nr:hypothetical protein [Candidatus Woesearchaeota archaeon]
MKWLIVSVLIALVALAGCGQKAAPAATQSTESQVSGFEQDIAEVDSLNEDLDSSELDSLDQDLATV